MQKAKSKKLISVLPITIEKIQLQNPIQCMSSETAEDVAKVHKLQYKRYSVLTGVEPVAFFEKSTAFMKDFASEMKLFIEKLKELLQCSYGPYSLDCVVHTVLG